jgi:hypothetical protein
MSPPSSVKQDDDDDNWQDDHQGHDVKNSKNLVPDCLELEPGFEIFHGFGIFQAMQFL